MGIANNIVLNVTVFPAQLLHQSIDSFLSNEGKYLKIHYDRDALPEDRSVLLCYNFDVCKWHLFVSNLTEDVFACLKTTFEMDYVRSLRFQQLPEEPASAS